MHYLLILVLLGRGNAALPVTIQYADLPSRAACRAEGARLERNAPALGTHYGAWWCAAQPDLAKAPAVHRG